MKKIINCSWYGKEGEKLNEHVSMFASERCPNCKGNTRSHNDNFICGRCKGDGWLTNPVKFIPDALTCASNAYKLGTWLRITVVDYPYYDSFDKHYEKSIIVLNSDRMASWLNSEDGKFKYVCNECHDLFNDKDHEQYFIDGKSACNGKLIQTRDIDLSICAFEKLAPLDKGVIEIEVEIL